ncbi:MAG: hypothetical protein CO118_10485 [Flavobacteriales bacterium CG_4_9_14_3_um_filter_32_8]|nr:MAG: hypothetical protein CO118_10485 [Flavobacteriales bacterium CG_4_9_14_3_um_filter_32_8]
MKKIVPFLIVVIFLASCKSSSKQLAEGNYDAALQKSAKKIKKNPGSFDEVDTFNDAYRLAYAQDNTEVNRLKQEGNPANWSRIYQLYVTMKGRQDLAASLPPVGINYEEKDFSGEIANAKTNATEYAYAKGDELMAKNNKMDARLAYDKYNEVKSYNPDYKEVKEKISAAKLAGTTNVFFRIEDNTKMLVPKVMMEEIQNIDVNELDKQWTNYDSYIDTNILYHYSIILNLKLIDVAPEKVAQNATIESKEVPDGFDYVLDANGNVKKDSLGNDIKIPRFKTITCKVVRFQQNKAARVAGDLEYYDNATDQLIKTEPIASDALFENRYAVAYGNIDALSLETNKEINNTKPIPFPPDEALIMQAGEVIKKMTKDIIVKNKDFVK